MFPNQYQFPTKIAQGGSAEIYRAIQANDIGFERVVAIKRILPKHKGDRLHESMLVSEAHLLVTLNHPNIVRVFDLGFSDGAYFFIMEYVDGCDLRSVMQWFHKHRTAIPLDCVILIMAEVAKALEYAHQKVDSLGHPLEIVHLDVSPKNILLSRSGEVKLTDFGIASFQRGSQVRGRSPAWLQENVVRGKFGYMSPEQARGEPLDYRSDIFSLGLLFYEMLTGIRFYQSIDLSELQKEHRAKNPSAPLFSSEVPESLEFIVLQCLAIDSEKRYGSAGDLCRDLLRFLYETLGTIPHQQLAYMMEEVMAEIPKKSLEIGLQETQTHSVLSPNMQITTLEI